MIRRRVIALAVLSGSTLCAHAQNPVTWNDVAGDAMIRRTDALINGELGPDCVLPNLVTVTVGTWDSPTAASNPYSGYYVPPDTAHLIKIDLKLRGLVNPPGSVAQSTYAPFVFGPSPLYGFIEFDVDSNFDTGGELGAAARNRYLANVSRFGRSAPAAIASRAPRFGREIDSDFFTPPQIERSGTDFCLAFCGCYTTTIVSQSGNMNGKFDAGETWIIRGGFFQRAGGYQSICSSSGGASGLQTGLYTPLVNLRWSHDAFSDTTTITLVFPATQVGAGQLTGQPAQPVNLSASDQASIEEALSDLIQSAPFALPNTPVWHLSNGWQGQNPADPQYRRPSNWKVTGLVGTAYAAPVNGAIFVWTDSGFGDVMRDLDGDGLGGPQDKYIVVETIDALDGTIWDGEGEGAENGNVRLDNPGTNWALADVNGDGNINRFDINILCPGDFNQDGTINILDYIYFFNAYSIGDTRADLNLNGTLDTGDFVTFLNAIAAGC